MTANACGSCRMCCKLLAVGEIDKPVDKWCPHSCPTGCGIYPTRPEPCRIYRCMWLVSQGTPQAWAMQARPDNCGVVFDAMSSNPGTVVARVSPPDRHKLDRTVPQAIMASIFKAGLRVVITCGDLRKIVAGST